MGEKSATLQRQTLPLHANLWSHLVISHQYDQMTFYFKKDNTQIHMYKYTFIQIYTQTYTHLKVIRIIQSCKVRNCD